MEWKECLHRTCYEDVISVSEFSAKNEVDVNEISIHTANLVTSVLYVSERVVRMSTYYCP